MSDTASVDAVPRRDSMIGISISSPDPQHRPVARAVEAEEIPQHLALGIPAVEARRLDLILPFLARIA